MVLWLGFLGSFMVFSSGSKDGLSLRYLLWEWEGHPRVDFSYSLGMVGVLTHCQLAFPGSLTAMDNLQILHTGFTHY